MLPSAAAVSQALAS